ncbi:MAG: hypothetical protein WCS37_07675 [Chloroflexota bacterium]|nr:hypothetical protein [Chloroflexota bacterium]
MAQVEVNQQKETLDVTRGSGGKTFTSTTGPLLVYWGFCLAMGLVILRDEIFSLRIPEMWGKYPFFLAYAILITLFNEWAYIKVARHDGRPFNLNNTIIFTLANGVCEVFAFMGFYRIFEGAAKLILEFVGFAPSSAGHENIVADIIIFIFGFAGFVIYSGLVHALFWGRLLPRHFSSAPEVQKLRKALGLIQMLIVLGWCLYFWNTGDIWTLVILHLIIDAVLMARVRPPLFTRREV